MKIKEYLKNKKMLRNINKSLQYTYDLPPLNSVQECRADLYDLQLSIGAKCERLFFEILIDIITKIIYFFQKTLDTIQPM